LIAVLLAAAIGSAIVKGGNSKPVVLATPTPAQTYTYSGLPPTATPSETPIIPLGPTPTPTVEQLARTGSSSFTSAAALMLGLAFAGGVAVLRASRRD
jgi:hypothetical protein